jgi:hypothetical protein
MAGEDEVERLRRAAYGPGASTADRAAAEAALRALAAQPAEAVDDAAPSPSDAEAPDDVDEDIPEPVLGRSIRVGWLVPIVAGALLVGALAALGATGRFSTGEPDAAPTSSPPPSGAATTVRIPGDLQAADAWFDGAATASDVYPFSGLLDTNGIDPYQVRFALAGGGGWNVWVARSATGQLCLLIADAPNGGGTAGCVEKAEFARNGAQLALGSRVAHWYGGEVTTSPNTGPDGDSASDASRPALPQAGPGDIDAAAEWFTGEPTSSDVFPQPGALAGLGIDAADVRALGTTDPAWTLWLARSRSGEYCILATTNLRAVFSECATAEEFRDSGVNLIAQGHSAFWDGESVVSG